MPAFLLTSYHMAPCQLPLYTWTDCTRRIKLQSQAPHCLGREYKKGAGINDYLFGKDKETAGKELFSVMWEQGKGRLNDSQKRRQAGIVKQQSAGEGHAEETLSEKGGGVIEVTIPV